MRKLVPSALAVGLVAVACGPPRVIVQPGGVPGEPQFFVQVLDAQADVGHGLSLTVDAEGNPHLAYLGFAEEPAEGEPPPVPEPGDPVFPAVLHAHVTGDLVTRSVVADSTPPEGEEEPVERPLSPEDQTAIAVDADGIHHVAWTEGGSLLYANNAEGAFGEPVEVATGATGISIAAEGGTAWVGFYGGDGVQAASIADGEATVEDVAPAEAPDPAGTGIGVSGEQVLVAYGDGAATMLARRDGGDWATETADQDGGVGVSMAVDADGNPHLAYFDSAGTVKHAHSIDGAPWEVSDVGDAGGAAQSPAAIALDGEGLHHVAWQSAECMGYASNAEGDFAEEEVPVSVCGSRPGLGAGADGVVYLAWFDTEGKEVQLAVRTDEPPPLALPESPAEEAPAAPADTGEPECLPEGTQLAIAAPPGATLEGFDKTCLAAPAGEPFTIDFDNQDEGVPHNVAVYQSQGGAEIFVGEIITGPDQIAYDVDPIEEEGNLFFQCDVHPQTMTGTFSVVGEGGGGGGEDQAGGQGE
ncbi:MAG TPA: hypothetical protein VHL78_12885 [Actinomycetota bacterium]|nr:hypothetical protein [Actinomycetota bacterium]